MVKGGGGGAKGGGGEEEVELKERWTGRMRVQFQHQVAGQLLPVMSGSVSLGFTAAAAMTLDLMINSWM